MKIKQLTLFTKNPDKQKDFYTNVLGLEKTGSPSGNEISFKVGNSVLTFIKRDRATPYHFAINIHSNLIKEALEWLTKRVPVLKYGEEEIHDFESWNARSVYFYDADKNIVEFIARKNLGQNSKQVFGPESLLEISEIGLPVTDIEKTFNKLNHETGLSIYSGSFDEFCAIGDERGLFVCMDKNKKKWFPVGDPVFGSDFNAEIVNYNKEYIITFTNGSLTINPK